MAPPHPKRRGPTAYFLFADSARAEVRAELVTAASAANGTAAASSEPPKISVAAVAKGVGERWKALTEAEREAWKEKAAFGAAEAATAREAAREGAAEEGAAEEGEAAAAAAPPPSSSFPLSVVRKLILLDPEVGRVSADAARAISMAAAAFASSTLAASAAAVAARAKRRTLRAADVAAAAARDTRCLDMGLIPVLRAVTGGAAAPAPAAKENAGPAPNPRGAGAATSAGSKRGPVAVGGAGGEGDDEANKKRKGKRVASSAQNQPARPAAAFFAPYKGKAAAT